MNTHKEALQKILEISTNKFIHDIATEALKEQSEEIKCPKCGSFEVESMTPRTTYSCGSSDYDQRPNTFRQSVQCASISPTEPIYKPTEEVKPSEETFYCAEWNKVGYVCEYQCDNCKPTEEVKPSPYVESMIPMSEKLPHSVEEKAEKEEIEVWMPSYWSSPDQVVNKYGTSVQGVERVKGYFFTKEELQELKNQSYQSALDSIKEWAENNCFSMTDQSGIYYKKAIDGQELLTYIQSLKSN